MASVLVGLGLFAGVAFAVQWVLIQRGDARTAQSADFKIWSEMVGAMIVVYAAVFVTNIDLARRWGSAKGWAVIVIVIYLVAAGLVFAVWHLPGSPPPSRPLQEGTGLVSPIVYLIAVIGGAPTALGLGWEYAWLRHVSQVFESRTPPIQAVDLLAGLIDARKNLQRCLVAMSSGVSVTVLGTGALRNAWLANGVPAKEVPPSQVLLFGALFTAAFAVAYIPAFLSLRRCANRFVDALYPLPVDARPSEAWTSGRLRLQQLIGADSTVSKNLTAAFGILAPLATSIAGTFIQELAKTGT